MEKQVQKIETQRSNRLSKELRKRMVKDMKEQTKNLLNKIGSPK